MSKTTWHEIAEDDDPLGPSDSEVWRFVLWMIALVVGITLMSAFFHLLERPIHELEKRRALLAQTAPRPAPSGQLRADFGRRRPPR